MYIINNRMLSLQRYLEAPATGLSGPYGAALLQHTPLQAASCLYVFMQPELDRGLFRTRQPIDFMGW